MEDTANDIFTIQGKFIFKIISLSLKGNLYCLLITSHVNILAAGTGTKDLTLNSCKVKRVKLDYKVNSHF